MIDRRAFVTAAAASLAAPAIARAQQSFTMKFASATINDIQHEFQKRFKEAAEAKSGGRLKVEIYPASQLGPIPTMVDGVTLGTIEAFTTATSFLSQIDPRFNVFDVPGVFGDQDKTRKILADPEVRRQVFAFGGARGIQSIALFMHSPNAIVARRPIRTLADLRGLKIRTLGSPLQIEPMKRVDAIPVPMPLSEVMPALQTGAIDGLIAGSTVMTAFRYYDVVKPMTVFADWPLVITVAVNRRWLDRLPADLRDIVLSVANEAEAHANSWGRNDVVESQKKWTQNGGEVIAASPDFMRELNERFSAATAPIIAGSAPLKAEVEFMRRAAARI